ncbi:hypothetical protein LJC14_06720 [Treponema sp. OttesenSCG-928-L16]|nr:hypothetical protein [Treponema sp. OttesenSCG-928-L16]
MGNKKNIIVYLSDQLRADTMGCYGQRLPVSPTRKFSPVIIFLCNIF